jgi:hypothetical protein
MADSVYVDNYTLVDTVKNSTVYNRNQMDTKTLTKDSYVPDGATTPTIDSDLRLIPSGAVLDTGYSQKALFELLLMIVTNWNNAMRSLDDKGVEVNNADYEELAAITNVAQGDFGGKYNSDCTEALVALGLPNQNETSASGLGVKINIQPNGIPIPELAVMCQAIASCFALATANLDGDSALTDTNYASTLDIDFTTKTAYVPPLTTTTPFNIFHESANGSPNPSSRITLNGIEQGALVDFLNTVVTNMNLLWVKLDADI